MPRRFEHAVRPASSFFKSLSGLALLAIVALPATPAIAQEDYAAQASGVHTPGAGEKNAAEALLVALSNMDAPPDSLPDTPTALLMVPGDDGWEEAKAWATAPNQRAALSTLREITNPGNPHTFSLPYGLENTPPSIQKTGLAIDLGDPPLLAAANLVYLDALDELFALASIDATRLSDENDPEAAYRMVQWIRLSRMIADQPLSPEKGWGIHSMRLGVMRLLDLFALHPELMSEREIIRLVKELSEDEIRIERILPPYADRIAMQQLVNATFIERRGPNPASFGPILAGLMSEGRPLGLFGEASYFQQVAQQQANWFDTTEKVDAIYNDWERRWVVPHYDEIWSQQMERRLIDPARYTIIEAFSPDLYPMFQDRLTLRADLAGARMALSVIGYRRGKGLWASDLAAIRPTFVDSIDADPFHDGGDRFVKQFEILEYFVPIRDQKFGPREDPHPHAIRVYRAGEIFQGLEDGSVDFDNAAIEGLVDQLMVKTLSAQRNAAQSIFQNFVDRFDEFGITRTNFRDLVHRDTDHKILDLVMPLNSEGIKSISESIGLPSDLSDEDKDDLAIETIRLLFEESRFTSALGAERRDARLTDQDAAGAIRAIIECASSSMANLVRKLQPSAFGPDHFDIELDDHNFIIYARGIDRRADWAKEVGVDAADYMIWPPILTLLRSELKGEGPMAAWLDD